MTLSPKVYVFAPVHNRRAITEKFVRNLLAQTYADWHLLLIDDGSKDGTGDMARALVPSGSLTVLRGKGNWWWAGSLQQGFLWLKWRGPKSNDLVLTMNDDTEFGQHFLANAVHAILPRSLLQAQCHTMAGELFEVGVRWDWATLTGQGVVDMAPVNCFATRGLFLHAHDFLELGGFHPMLLPHYLSDYEFTLRAHRKGFSLMSVPEVFLRFDESPGLTGIRSTRGLSILRGLLLNMSIRSTANPIYWSSFVILGSPVRYIPVNLLRVWWRFLSPIRHEISLFIAPVRKFFSPVRYFLGRIKRKVKREWAARMDATND